MSRLDEIQRAFAQGVIEGKPDSVAGEISSTGGSPLRMLALYRRLIRTNYISVLKVTYPVLYRLVGQHYFGLLAKGYLKIHPSTSGDLFPYGRFLPSFLEELGVPLLFTEVAKLDWACHEIHQAADSPPLFPDQIETMASSDPSRIIVRFHPALRLFLSPIPVHRVWLALQPDASSDKVVDLPLPKEETGILMARPFRKVQLTPLTKGRYLLLKALLEGKNLASVEQMALASNPEVDLFRFLADLLKQQIIIGFSLRDLS